MGKAERTGLAGKEAELTVLWEEGGGALQLLILHTKSRVLRSTNMKSISRCLTRSLTRWKSW
jgi:hypothetical protein